MFRNVFHTSRPIPNTSSKVSYVTPETLLFAAVSLMPNIVLGPYGLLNILIKAEKKMRWALGTYHFLLQKDLIISCKIIYVLAFKELGLRHKFM